MLRLLAATSGGLGLLRPAPGTWGSLPPAVLVTLSPLWGASVTRWGLAGLLLYGVLASVLLAPWYGRHFGRSDPGEVVCDEVAGMALCLMLLPWPSPWPPWALAAMAFALFRLMDIWKPPPIGSSQRLPGGWGVLIDDLLAGLAAAGLCWSALLLTG